MKLAVVFNGQGAQYAGMGQDFYQASADARAVYDLASQISQKPILEWCQTGSEALAETRNAQIAILATSLAIFESIKAQLPVISYMAGLSLGEYSALIAAGSLAYAEGFQVVNQRGELMSQYCQELSQQYAIQMAAVIKMPESEIVRLVAEIHQEDQPLYLANYNSQEQIVIAGSKDAIAQFREAAKELGYRKVIPLRVEGPFHTPLMAGVQAEYAQVLEQVDFQEGLPVLANLDAEQHELSKLKSRLVDHLVMPVRWQMTIEKLIAEGVTHLIQIGPGDTLAKFIKNDSRLQVLVIDQWEDQEGLAAFLKEEN